jgi:hypothetical protein
MANGAFFDEVKPENLKAMVDFTKEYGIYPLPSGRASMPKREI